jgi:arginyl-tRNA synthetase
MSEKNNQSTSAKATVDKTVDASVAQVIKNGLGLLGIETVDEM